MPHADSHRPAARDHRRRPQPSRDGRPVSGVLGLGYTDVATYIQSGNVVLASEEADTAMIAAALERAIAEHLGVRPKVVVLTAQSWRGWRRTTPSPRSPISDGSTRSSGTAPRARRARHRGSRPAASPRPGSDHEARVVGNTLFLHTPGGLGRSELAAQLLRLGGSRTAEPAAQPATGQP
jgi:uncharacterized protein (DUF1697 family)